MKYTNGIDLSLIRVSTERDLVAEIEKIAVSAYDVGDDWLAVFILSFARLLLAVVVQRERAARPASRTRLI